MVFCIKQLVLKYSNTKTLVMNKAYWNEIGTNYAEEIFSVFNEDRSGRLLEFFNKHANKAHTAIDFGCGTGNAFEYLAPRFKKVLALDFSEKLLETARERAYPNIEIKQMDLTKSGLQLPQAHFAFCCNVAMLADAEKNRAIIKNVQDGLRPGGAALFVLPSLESALFRSWMTTEWFRKEGTAFDEISDKQWVDYKYGIKSVLLGLVAIDGVITKHYLQPEIVHLFDEAGLKVTAVDKLEYTWNTEFKSPPAWMQSAYPWDWIVECRKK